MKTNIKKRKKWLKTNLTTTTETTPDKVVGEFLVLSMSYVEEDCLFLSDASIIFDTKIYLSAIPQEDKLWSCLITNLGAENQADVVFTKSKNFPHNETTLYEEVTDKNGNVFIKYPTYYRKTIVRVPTSYPTNILTGYEIANYKKDDDFEPYDCFLDEEENILPYVLIGKYQISSKSIANSVESLSYVQQTPAVFRNNARAVGTGYQLFDYAMYVFLRELTLAYIGEFKTATHPVWLGVKWWNSGTVTYLDGIAFDRGGTDYCNKPSKYVDNPDMGGYDKPEGYVRVFNSWVGGYSNYVGTIVSFDVNKEGKYKQVNIPNVTYGIGYKKYYGYGWVGADTGGYHPIVCNCQNGGYLFFMCGRTSFSDNYQARLCYRPISEEE